MKYFALFALLAIGTSALPAAETELTDARVGEVVDRIYAAIQRIQGTIQLLGLDPLDIDRLSGNYALPTPNIFAVAGVVEGLRSHGLSNIVINQMAYDVLNFVLAFNFEMPHIHVSLVGAAGEMVFFGKEYSAAASGRLDIRRFSLQGEAGISLLGGTSIRNLRIVSGLGEIDSDIQVRVADHNLSDRINNFLNVRVLATLGDFKPEVDELLSIVIKNYLNNNILG